MLGKPDGDDEALGIAEVKVGKKRDGGDRVLIPRPEDKHVHSARHGLLQVSVAVVYADAATAKRSSSMSIHTM